MVKNIFVIRNFLSFLFMLSIIDQEELEKENQVVIILSSNKKILNHLENLCMRSNIRSLKIFFKQYGEYKSRIKFVNGTFFRLQRLKFKALALSFFVNIKSSINIYTSGGFPFSRQKNIFYFEHGIGNFLDFLESMKDSHKKNSNIFKDNDKWLSFLINILDKEKLKANIDLGQLKSIDTSQIKKNLLKVTQENFKSAIIHSKDSIDVIIIPPNNDFYGLLENFLETGYKDKKLSKSCYLAFHPNVSREYYNDFKIEKIMRLYKNIFSSYEDDFYNVTVEAFVAANRYTVKRIIGRYSSAIFIVNSLFKNSISSTVIEQSNIEKNIKKISHYISSEENIDFICQ